jgi:tRNA (adenine22-N1)-methyltransferase
MLSPRLSSLRSHYDSHESVWDIGCDHGKLGLSFLKEDKVKKVHLVDPSPHVIKTLRHFIDSYITEQSFKLEIHEKSGQDVIPGPERKLILIAGMGGKEIESISLHLLNHLTPEDDLVISPHRDILQLRERLHSSPFSLVKESLIFDEGRFYQVISLKVKGERKVHPYGEEIFQGEEGEKYRQHQIAAFTAHQDVRSREYVQYLRGLTQCF